MIESLNGIHETVNYSNFPHRFDALNLEKSIL